MSTPQKRDILLLNIGINVAFATLACYTLGEDYFILLSVMIGLYKDMQSREFKFITIYLHLVLLLNKFGSILIVLIFILNLSLVNDIILKFNTIKKIMLNFITSCYNSSINYVLDIFIGKVSYTCSICLENIRSNKNKTILECGHTFCTTCLLRSYEAGNYTCPNCRAVLVPEIR